MHVRVLVADRGERGAEQRVAVVAAGQLDARPRPGRGAPARGRGPAIARRDDDVARARRRAAGRRSTHAAAGAHAEPGRWRSPADRSRRASTRRARLGEAGGDVDRGRGLADAALLVRQCVDPRHRPRIVPARSVGSGRAQRALRGHAGAPRKALRRRPALARRRARPGIRTRTTAPPQRGRREREIVARRLARPHHEPAAGPAQRQAELDGAPAAARARARRRTRRRRAARRARHPRSARRARAPTTPIARGGLADERRLARRRLDQVELAFGPHDAEHEARQTRRRCRRRPAGRPARRRRRAGPPSASRTCRAAASAGSRMAVTPTGVEQTSSTSRAEAIVFLPARAAAHPRRSPRGDRERRFT